MSTRLHALGFPAEWTEPVAQQVRRLSESARVIEAASGSYRLWRSRDGAELWFHVPHPGKGRRETAEPPGDVITPFHRGQSAIPIRIGRVLSVDRSSPLEGSCLAWLPKTSDGWRERAIALELVPFGKHAMKPLPQSTLAQILCCAHAVWAYDTEADYVAGTRNHRRMPLGSYVPVSEADVPEVPVSYRHSPATLGLISGRITRSIRLNNPASGNPYYWLGLETKRGLFDVVVNPLSVTGDISEGNPAQVFGSFLARLTGTVA